MAKTIAAMRDASVRRRFEKEIELTLAWEAEKMIVERFAGDWTSAVSFNEPSTSSFSFETSPSFFEKNPETKDSYSTWEELSNIDSHKEDKRESLAVFEKSKMCSGTTTQERRAVEGDRNHNFDQVVPMSGEHWSTSSTTAIVKNGVDEENRLVCATCGFSANNRKALYRHGLKTKHVLRESHSFGTLMCNLCSFRTNKTFNFNRHMKRFHGELIKNTGVTQSSAA
ncbi:Zinc finger C2H2 type [Trichostrongylus colubriformis]|uniref:Zinc finger C2H2 type n=1 Tax=Trichostrongylus colubriformis TaxID=6319 RepID=A0AAN8EYG7_TRICO